MADIKAVLDGAARLFEKRPEQAAHSVSVHGELVGTTEVRFEVGSHVITYDEADYLGGQDRGPNPVATTLATLGACEAIIYRCYAERLGIAFDKLSVDVEGDLDLRGGLDIEGVRAGFEDIRLIVHLTGTESQERYEALHEVVAENCPVLDSLRGPVRVATSLHVTV